MNQNPPGTPGHSTPREGDGAGASKIRHSQQAIGRGIAAEPAPVPVAEADGPLASKNMITAFGEVRKHEEEWSRTPNTTGTGAIHVKTFHSKLTDDALRYMDQTINEWLDAHPQYEVKFVNSTVGTLTSKLKEPHIICQVWV